jgi:hypothetical protein
MSCAAPVGGGGDGAVGGGDGAVGGGDGAVGDGAVGGGDGAVGGAVAMVDDEVAMVDDEVVVAAGAFSSFPSRIHGGCSVWLSYQKTRGTSKGGGGRSHGWRSGGGDRHWRSGSGSPCCVGGGRGRRISVGKATACSFACWGGGR